MSKKYLVIVESPGKIKKLKSILGAEYEIVACMGHVVDLPTTSFGIDLNTMQAEYVVLKAEVAKRIRAEATKPYSVIFLASDPDREGEAISFHVASLLKRAKTTAQLQRVTFDAITPSAVKTAFANPRQIDNRLVAAQEARRLLDRLVGFPASRFLWQFVSGKGLSAGRVQSVALRLVVERDEAIAKFIPEEYWTILGVFRAKGGEFSAKLTQWQGKKPALKNKADAENVLNALKNTPFRIVSVTPKQRQQKPTAPFTTSTLQQTASSHLKLSPDATMKLAQQLYEAGYISYMRTDSPTVSPEGASMAKATIQHLYGEKYVGSHTYGAKSNAQEAHECIRPTDTDASPDAIRMALGVSGGRVGDVYELIWKRFVASQMANAVFNEVHVRVAGGVAVFSAKGSQLAFDGFLRVYGYSEEKEQRKREDEDDEDEPVNKQLPVLTAGEAVQAVKFTPQQHFTQPPAHYSEALLIKALEQAGVGRPSTYAQTVATLKNRGYVVLEKRQLHATPLGQQVTQVLVGKLPQLFEVGFTAQMETALDDIALGKQNGRDYLKAFWAQVSPLFGEKIVQATLAPKPQKTRTSDKSPVTSETKTATGTTRKKASATKNKPPVVVDTTLGVCPKCGNALVKRTSKHGEFLGCSAFPKCRHIEKGG
jgi:DNA topoisomerase-1